MSDAKNTNDLRKMLLPLLEDFTPLKDLKKISEEVNAMSPTDLKKAIKTLMKLEHDIQIGDDSAIAGRQVIVDGVRALAKANVDTKLHDNAAESTKETTETKCIQLLSQNSPNDELSNLVQTMTLDEIVNTARALNESARLYKGNLDNGNPYMMYKELLTKTLSKDQLQGYRASLRTDDLQRAIYTANVTCKNYLDRAIYEGMAERNYPKDKSANPQTLLSQFSDRLFCEPRRAALDELKAISNIALKLLTDEQQSNVAHQQTLDTATVQQQLMNNVRDGKYTQGDKCYLADTQYLLELARRQAIMQQQDDPHIATLLTKSTEAVQNFVTQNTFNKDDNTNIHKAVEHFISNNLLNQLYFADSAAGATRSEGRTALSLPITPQMRSFFLENANLIQGQVALPGLQECMLKSFGSDGVADPEKLKDPILQKQFSAAASKNIGAFIAIETELANSALTLDKETKTAVTTGILSSLAKGPELKEDKFVAEASTRISNLMALQAEATSTLKLDPTQQQKIATSLLPALANLPPLGPADAGMLSKYISETLEHHATLASSIRTDTTKISKDALPEVIDKIVKEHEALSKFAEQRAAEMKSQPTKIINNAIGRAKLQLKTVEKAKIHAALTETLNDLSLDVTDKSGAGAKAVMAITDVLVAELAKSTTRGSKVRGAVGIKDERISSKMLEQIKVNLIAGHKAHLEAQEKERLSNENRAGWDKVGKTTEEINAAVISSLTPAAAPPIPKPVPKPRKLESTIMPVDPSIADRISQLTPVAKPRRQLGTTAGEVSKDISARIEQLQTPVAKPRQPTEVNPIGKLPEGILAQFEARPIPTPRQSIKPELRQEPAPEAIIPPVKPVSELGFFGTIASAVSKLLKGKEKPTKPAPPQQPTFNSKKFLDTLNEITKEVHAKEAKAKAESKTKAPKKPPRGVKLKKTGNSLV